MAISWPSSWLFCFFVTDDMRFWAQLVANRETSDVVAFSKGSFMPLRGEITSKSISFGLVLYIKGSKWSCLFNYKIGDGRS